MSQSPKRAARRAPASSELFTDKPAKARKYGGHLLLIVYNGRVYSPKPDLARSILSAIGQYSGRKAVAS